MSTNGTTPDNASESAFSLSITVGGETFDLSDLTLEEAELLEDAFDRPLSEIDLARTKAVRILYFIAQRRRDPSFSMEQVERMPITAVVGAPPAEEPKPKRPTRARKTGG